MEVYVVSDYYGRVYFEVHSVTADYRITGKLKFDESGFFRENKKCSIPEQVNGSEVLHGLRLNLDGIYFNSSNETEGLCSLELWPEVEKRRLIGHMDCDPLFW